METFNQWNNLKKKLEVAPSFPEKFPKEGQVWMGSVGKNIGFEQNGSGELFSRPVLVVRKFNNHMFWAVPLSTKQKSLDFYFNYTDPNGQKVSVILAQMRLVSVKRVYRKMYEMPPSIFCCVRQRLRSFL